MLSLSADATKSEVDLNMVNGEESATSGDVAHAEPLMKFAGALASRDEEELATARAALLEQAGAPVLVDAAAVAGNFQRMVRIADATGIPLDEAAATMGHVRLKDLELDRFASAQHTPAAGLKRRLLSTIIRPIAPRLFSTMLRKVER